MYSCLKHASLWWVWGSKNRQPVVIKQQPRVPQPGTSGSHPTHSLTEEARGRSQELLWSLYSRHNSSQAESITDRRGTAIIQSKRGETEDLMDSIPITVIPVGAFCKYNSLPHLTNRQPMKGQPGPGESMRGPNATQLSRFP